ncbi:hypothetical protein R6Q57_011188 [Mikania cordata]
MCLLIFIGANSETFANTGALVTCVTNFPEGRGAVLGLLKGFVGLSGAIISQLYHAFYGHDSKSLILFIGWLPAAVSILFLPIVRVLKSDRHANDLKIMYKFLYISLGLAGFLMAIIVAQHKVQFSVAEYAATASVVVTLLMAPVVIVFKDEHKLWKTNQEVAVNHFPSNIIITENQDNKIEIPTVTPSENQISCWKTAFTPPERGEDFTILQALLCIDMRLLFAATAFGVGGVMTAIDNLSQIGQSLGYPKATISTFVSLVSIGNYLGRVFCQKSCRLYDKEARKQMVTKGLVRKEGEDLTCMGVNLYKTSFLIITAATVFACMLSIVLVVRTREFYRGDICKKFRELPDSSTSGCVDGKGLKAEKDLVPVKKTK